MSNEDLNYEEDLRIDPDNLDVEWLEQPSVFMKYSELSAQAEKEARKAEEKVKIIRSELVLLIYSDPEKYLGEDVKPTAQLIEAAYRKDRDHRAAKKAFVLAQHRADVLRQAVSAFHQRRVALENLVRLQAQGYFAGPSEPRDLPIEFEKNAKHRRAVDRIKQGTQRKRSRRTR